MRKLTTCAATVNQSISMAYFPAAWAMTWFQNGLAKMQDHRDHEAVDRHGLDHRQADEQGAGDGGGGIGLLRQRSQCRGDRAPFAERGADAAEGDGEAGSDDRCHRDDRHAVHVLLSWLCSWFMRGFGSAFRLADLRVAAAM